MLWGFHPALWYMQRVKACHSWPKITKKTARGWNSTIVGRVRHLLNMYVLLLLYSRTLLYKWTNQIPSYLYCLPRSVRLRSAWGQTTIDCAVYPAVTILQYTQLSQCLSCLVSHSKRWWRRNQWGVQTADFPAEALEINASPALNA